MAYINGNDVFVAANITPTPAQLQAEYDEGMEAGKQAEYDRFWDAYQQNGERPVWTNAFQSKYWIDDCYNPKYPINIVSQSVSVYNATQITDTKVDIIVNATECTHIFANARALKTIKKLILNVDTGFSNWFFNNDALENIVIEGIIYQNIDFHYSNNLTHDSLMNIISCLLDDGADAENLLSYPYSDTTKTDDNGITWTDNGSGSITVNGTSGTLDSPFYFLNGSLILSAGTYTFSLGENISDIKIAIYAGETNIVGWSATGEDITFTLNEETEITSIYIYPEGLMTFENVMLAPKLIQASSVTTHICTLGTVNLAKLTDEEKATATEKGWTLA